MSAVRADRRQKTRRVGLARRECDDRNARIAAEVRIRATFTSLGASCTPPRRASSARTSDGAADGVDGPVRTATPARGAAPWLPICYENRRCRARAVGFAAARGAPARHRKRYPASLPSRSLTRPSGARQLSDVAAHHVRAESDSPRRWGRGLPAPRGVLAQRFVRSRPLPRMHLTATAGALRKNRAEPSAEPQGSRPKKFSTDPSSRRRRPRFRVRAAPSPCRERCEKGLRIFVQRLASALALAGPSPLSGESTRPPRSSLGSRLRRSPPSDPPSSPSPRFFSHFRGELDAPLVLHRGCGLERHRAGGFRGDVARGVQRDHRVRDAAVDGERRGDAHLTAARVAELLGEGDGGGRRLGFDAVDHLGAGGRIRVNLGDPRPADRAQLVRCAGRRECSTSRICAARAYLLTAPLCSRRRRRHRWRGRRRRGTRSPPPGRARRGAGDIRLDAGGVAENLEGDLGGSDVLGVAADAQLDAIYGAGVRGGGGDLTAGEGSLGLEGEALGDVKVDLTVPVTSGACFARRCRRASGRRGGLLDVEGTCCRRRKTR